MTRSVDELVVVVSIQCRSNKMSEEARCDKSVDKLLVTVSVQCLKGMSLIP